MYNEIQEKGLFLGFDQKELKNSQVPSEEIHARMLKRKLIKPIELGLEGMGGVFG